jgi:pyruvate/2-oxoglutarate dehydrogenase complex dihydrolipoamide acyltransferase (E2) component
MREAGTTEEPTELDGILRRLVAHRGAVVPLDRLPGLLGVAVAEARPIVGALELAGLVERWPDSPDGPAVVLSATAAERLGVELVVSAEANPERKTGTRSLRWVPIGQARPERAAEPVISDLGTLAGTDGIEATADNWPDPRALDPADQVEADDHPQPPPPKPRSGRAVELSLARVHIRLILGLGIPWPARARPDKPCPGCGGRRLPSYAVCLVEGCDRTGVDALLPSVPASERPRPFHEPPAGLAGGRNRPGRGRPTLAKRTSKRRRSAATAM